MINTVRLLAFCLFGATSVANACMVDPRARVLSDIDTAYSMSDAVFVGTVVSVAPIDSGWARVTIRVSERFKGDVEEQVSLAAPTSRIGCNPHIDLGTDYIAFARNRPTDRSIRPIRTDEVAAASAVTVTPVEAPVFVEDTVAPSTGGATNEYQGDFAIDNSIANLRGLDPSAGPTVPWDGDFVLDVTLEVESTYAPYLERVGSALTKLHALRADEVKE